MLCDIVNALACLFLLAMLAGTAWVLLFDDDGGETADE